MMERNYSEKFKETNLLIYPQDDVLQNDHLRNLATWFSFVLLPHRNISVWSPAARLFCADSIYTYILPLGKGGEVVGGPFMARLEDMQTLHC